MAATFRLPLVLTVLVAWAGASCHPVGSPTELMGPSFGFSSQSMSSSPSHLPEQIVRATAATSDFVQEAPVLVESKPGSRVIWKEAPPLRAAPPGVGTFLADIESHLPPEMGTRYRDRNRLTWCHETTHGVHAALRNSYGLPAFYPGGGRFAQVKAPAISLGDVAVAVPPQLRGRRYQLYLVSQRREWDRDPLYIWDEWVAYNNGTTTGIEEGSRSLSGQTDDAMACLELSGYALAVTAAARRKGIPVDEQLREVLAWELRRSLSLYVQAMQLPGFAWPDRRLERLWREGDPFVVEELRALYGERLTVHDLLP